MTESNTTSTKPVWRLGFAPRNGTDRNGQPSLGYPIEIGAVFNRKDPSKGMIAKFNIVPEDLKDGGALLLLPVRDTQEALL